MLPSAIVDALPIIQPAMNTIVSTLFAALFLSRNTRKTEMEKLKAGKYKELSEELLNSGKMTYYEFYKCNNFLKIAKLADNYHKELHGDCFSSNDEQTKGDFNFDWFLRFFDSVGNISNEDMQILWARVLCGETHKPGSFSFRTIETLKNMSYEEANAFQTFSQLRIISPYNEVLLLHSNDSFEINKNEPTLCVPNDCEWDEILCRLYDAGYDDINILIQCGLLSSVFSDSYFFMEEESYVISNNVAIIEISQNLNCQINDKQKFMLKGYRFTQAAQELFSIVDLEPSLMYLLDTARLIKYFNPNINVSVFEFERVDENNVFYYDDEKNILTDPTYYHITRFSRLSEEVIDKSKVFV